MCRIVLSYEQMPVSIFKMETQKKWATQVVAPRAHKTLDQPQLRVLHHCLAHSLQTSRKEEFNAHVHPPISAREGPGATPVTWNGLDLFRSRVFNYSKPGIQHHQRKGSGRSGQHPPGWSSRTWHLLQIFLGRSGGRKEGRDAENALMRPLNQSLSASPPERNTSATTVTSKCAGWL